MEQHIERVTGERVEGEDKIEDLPEISEIELDENPQLVLEHITGTKRGYLTQVLKKIELSNQDIPFAPNSNTANSGSGGFRYYITNDNEFHMEFD
ncbi:hypothetical protein JCM19236_3811 [Vibrio sp. JCM 19236]|nr:hypothetical protein JCM19236_3811 [Vibrio sp. JCM 19236]